MIGMRILLCHNYYQQAGGEDSCFADEASLLERHGHTVFRYIRDNEGIGGLKAISTAAKTIWNIGTIREVRRIIRREKIDLVHCTNTFPLISPSIYYACNRERTPVVQSLHNYRLMCANSYFLRDGKVCEDCLNRRIAIPAIKHKCYRDNRFATTAVVALQAVHHGVGSWRNRVDQFIALTEFAKSKFVQAGLPGDRISIKPNFVDPTPSLGTGSGGYALFVGRLSEEKGIAVLLEAWRDARCAIPLRIVGDGPLKQSVLEAAEQNSNIQYIGFQQSNEVLAHMRDARFLVVPSLWYEGLPRTIVESFAVGTPVITSDVGPLKDIVRNGDGGMRFKLGDSADLARVVGEMTTEKASELRLLAKREFENRYTADKNYESLMSVYDAARMRAIKRR